MSDQAIQLVQGDCLEIMPLIPAGSVDMICTDLPYGQVQCAWDVVIPFAPLWEAYRRLVKPSGAIVLFGCQPFTSALVMSNPKMFRYSIVWDKVNRITGSLNCSRMPMRQHEDLLVFYSRLPTYNPQMRIKERVKCGWKAGHGEHVGHGKDSERRVATPLRGNEHFPTSILSVPSGGGDVNGSHPTQKPVALLEYLIRTYTNPGDTVLDSCMGSGSTAIACMRTGRKFIGIEKNADYFEVSCQRVKDEQQQGRLFTL